VKKLWNWVKNNKLSTFLLVILFFVFFGNNFSSRSLQVPTYGSISGVSEMSANTFMGADMAMPTSYRKTATYDAAPNLEVEERMVVTSSRLSLVVKNVKETLESIENRANTLGGYMVTRDFSKPEHTSTGNITIIIPAEDREQMLNDLRNMAVKVVSEKLIGEDITDQYMDAEARLQTHYKTKAIFESMLEKAETVEEIMKVQKQVLSEQQQIDAIKGQLEYMQKTAQTTRITVYVSTHELDLPFTPDEPWSAKNVLKYATRQLIRDARKLAGAGIWLGVYSVLWVPALIIILVIRKARKNKKQKTDQPIS
jgi:hypothetical protein